MEFILLTYFIGFLVWAGLVWFDSLLQIPFSLLILAGSCLLFIGRSENSSGKSPGGRGGPPCWMVVYSVQDRPPTAGELHVGEVLSAEKLSLHWYYMRLN